MDFIQEGFIQAITLLINRDPATFSSISATLRASGLALAASLLLGIPLGYLLGYFDFRLKKQIRTIVDTLLALPTVLIGLVLYAFLTRKGPLGEAGLLFSIPGIAIGQAILSLPIIISLTATAVEAVDRNLHLTLMSLGANRRQIAMSTLWEVRLGILAAAVTGAGRVLTEVGISLMVGGNIKWHTRTITTAIALETSKGEFGTGIALGLVLLLIALTVNITLAGLRRRV
ncbi:MAG: ABC transporter permease [Deltaproteobacteria bacterium]|jgi:tungstate transport system permease protein|nr:ABC transporter permease [Deltaproteobacteria bacterium]